MTAEIVGGLPVVRVRGGSHERGRAVGEALGPAIHRSLSVYRSWLGARGVTADDLPRILGPYREAAAATYPELVREIDGMALGADAPWWELFAANSYEELEEAVERGNAGAPDRCSAFSVQRGGRTWLGHDEQWFAAETPNCAVVVAVPDDDPAFASPTVASCLPAVGLNAAGAAQAIMSLQAHDDGVGIPRVLVSRAGLRAGSPDDAVARATPDGRAGSYAHLFAFADGGRMTIETGATSHAIVAGDAHTNHYLDPGLAAGADPADASSVGRLRVLEEETRRARFDGPEDVREVLALHRGDPEHVCRHPRPDEGEEAEGVIFAIACDPAARRLWVAGGTPCRRRFEEVDLTTEFAA